MNFRSFLLRTERRWNSGNIFFQTSRWSTVRLPFKESHQASCDERLPWYEATWKAWVFIFWFARLSAGSFGECDKYESDYTVFNVLGIEVWIENDKLSEALKALTEKKRNIILLSYFMDMADGEISVLSISLVQTSSITEQRRLKHWGNTWRNTDEETWTLTFWGYRISDRGRPRSHCHSDELLRRVYLKTLFAKALWWTRKCVYGSGRRFEKQSTDSFFWIWYLILKSQ